MYLTPSQTNLISAAQSYVSSALGYPILATSIENIIAVMNAMLIGDQYGFIQNCFSQTTPFTATAPYLDSWAALKNIFRIPAANALGNIGGFVGTAGTQIPAGSILNGSNGQQYVTQTTYIIGTTTSVPANAVIAGAAGSGPIGTTATLVTSISGVSNPTGTFSSAIAGGADVETDNALRTRTILAFAQPSQGGSTSDLTQWCLSTPGVTRAWVIGNYIGSIPMNGAVTVYTMFDNTESLYNGFPQGSAGVSTYEPRYTPATLDLLAVANQVYNSGQPITMLVWSAAPTPQPINITITGLGVSNYWNGTWTTPPNNIQTGILTSIESLFVNAGTVYGNKPIPISQLYAALEGVSGISTFNISTPTTQITTGIGNLPVVGNLTLQA